jgi:hypothetical protein
MAKSASRKPVMTSWRVLQTVELDAPAAEVWSVVGGFYTIHLWHPDIALTEVPDDQVSQGAIRRILTFPGQPKTTEELILMDNPNCHYRYKWYAGQWGELVKDYVAEIRIFETGVGERAIMQWSSTFTYFEDALSEFYWTGFKALQKRFPPPKSRRPKR